MALQFTSKFGSFQTVSSDNCKPCVSSRFYYMQSHMVLQLEEEEPNERYKEQRGTETPHLSEPSLVAPDLKKRVCLNCVPKV